MNVHHLELFYYVARYRGIGAAVRHIPWGIQQPAVSEQIRLLEEERGGPLFERQPFCLTPRGTVLYESIRTFFEMIALAAQSGESRVLQIAAPQVVLNSYLPDFFELMRRRFPRIRILMRSGSQHRMMEDLIHGEADLLIAPLEPLRPTGIECVSLVKLPIVLLAHASCRISHAKYFWAQEKIGELLIEPHTSESVVGNFRRGLLHLGVTWEPAILANALFDVTEMVRQNSGIGLSVQVPKLVDYPELRVLPLPGFDPVEIAAYWRPPAIDLISLLVRALRERARNTWPKRA